jgi:ADP-ribosyl-[dinitrogen reductase] hydrolase
MSGQESRFLGCLLGLAVGDALGTTLEFKRPGSFEPITDMVGGGPFELEAGEWTDDTSMALCLADSLITKGGFDPIDQLERYWLWYSKGYLSSTGTCFDIGNTTALALMTFHRDPQPYPGSTSPNTAGNGSLMRLAPVPMFYARNAREAISRCAESSRTTHGAQTAVDACRYYGGLLVAALNGTHKDTLLSSRYSPVGVNWAEGDLHPEIDAVAAGSFKEKQPPEISGGGYVVRTLEAALWAFYNTDTFRDGALMVVNLGDDADTTGAVYGQIAGAYYGVTEIPQPWLDKIAMGEYIRRQARRLCELSMEQGS